MVKLKPEERLIVAIDVETEKKALDIVEKLKNDVRFFKIGFELFSSCGPSIVKKVKEKGCEVFLDLKFHDIPNTVAKAAASITNLGAFMFNVHGIGGYDMMKKANDAVSAEAAKLKITKPKIIAVTVLTSIDEEGLKKIGIEGGVKKEVIRLAHIAKEAGLDGVVASPEETSLIRDAFGPDFLIVTPGIRPSWAAANDQKRITTPAEAIRRGADFIVVGRPITDAPDMTGAAKKIIEEIRGE